MTARRRTLGLVLAAIAFGVVAGVVKGDSAGLRSDIGNVSAPWLLVGLIPAAWSRSVGRGIAMGTVCSLAALLGFYATLTVVLSGHLGGGGYLSELRVELDANRIYLLAGVGSGPLCGAWGARLARSRRAWLWLAAGALLIGEVIAVAALNGRQLMPAPLYFSWTVSDWPVYIAEGVAGLTVAAAAAWSLRARATRGA
jgi:hypothetical protein